MNIILAFVTSVNGKITKGNDPDIYSWTSKEDSELFFGWIKENNAIIMGSGTYEAAREKIKRNPGKLRIVMTRNPEKYAAEQMPDVLEFTSKTPQEIVADLESRGYLQALHVGGSQAAALFLKENLINTLWLTLEPYIFGEGEQLFEMAELENKLKLLSYEQLNEQGTILLKYNLGG